MQNGWLAVVLECRLAGQASAGHGLVENQGDSGSHMTFTRKLLLVPSPTKRHYIPLFILVLLDQYIDHFSALYSAIKREGMVFVWSHQYTKDTKGHMKWHTTGQAHQEDRNKPYVVSIKPSPVILTCFIELTWCSKSALCRDLQKLSLSPISMMSSLASNKL